MKKIVNKKIGRLAWLDQLKAISMYIVVLGHALLNFKKHKLFKFIYSFHMPLFFMISGFTFNPDKYEHIAECIKDKAIKLIYPYVMLNILALPLWYINVRTGMMGQDSIMKLMFGIAYSNSSVARAPSNATWFIMTLFLAEIIYYVIHHFLQDDKSVFLMSCILCVIGVIAPLGKEVMDAPFHLDVSLVAQFYYGCGYFLRKHFDYVKECFSKHTYFKILFLVLVGMFFSIINKQVDMSNEVYRNFVYMLITSFSISIVMFYVCYRIQFHSKIILYIGRNTIIILAFHILVLRVLQACFPFFLENQLHAVLASIIVYVLMIPLVWFINTFLHFMVKMPNSLQKLLRRI